MKKQLMALVLMPLMALADQWTDEKGFTWFYRVIDGKAIIDNNGNVAVAPWPHVDELVVPSNLGTFQVEGIANYAFCGVAELTSVVIPQGVTSIGDSAFSCFDGLTSIEIPPSVTNIGDLAFEMCQHLTAIAIPAGVCKIGKQVFSGCSDLETIAVDPLNLFYSSKSGVLCSKDGKTLLEGVNGDFVMSDEIVDIAPCAFCDRYGLTSVTIPRSVTNVGQFAFARCPALKSVVIEGADVFIGEGAFDECNAVTSVTMSGDAGSAWWIFNSSYENITNVVIVNGSTRIVDCAFDGFMSLISVKLPVGIKHIGDCAFQGCDRLQSIVLPEGLENIGMDAFGGAGLVSLEIPSSVTKIGAGAFACSRVEAIEIPDGVEVIAEDTFYCCEEMLSVEIPNSVFCIGDRAFCGCSSLSTVTIPESVMQVGRDVFLGSGLESISFEGHPPVGLADAGLGVDAVVHYNIRHEKEWTEWLAEHPEFSASPYNCRLYVSETSMAEIPDGKSWATAFRQIQDAVDVAKDDDTIIVGPGKYLPVSVAVDRLNIESVKGAAQTIIEAEPYSGNSYSTIGGGSCFSACANYDPWSTDGGYYVDYGQQIGQSVRLDGFTLRHGFAKSNSYAMQYGGGVFGGVVSNCIVEDNYGTSGGGACRATLENCIIRNNRGVYGTGAMSCVLRHCTVVNNRHSGEVLLYATECVEDEGVAVAGSSTIEDSIVVNNVDAAGEENNYYRGGTVISTSGNSYSTIQVVVSNTVVKSSCTRPLAFGNGNIADDPCLVDLESGDCRLRSGSPCIERGMGAVPYDNEFDAIAKALGATKLHWAADDVWRAGDSLIAVGNIGDGRAAVVDAVTEGSGWLRFDWKCDSASGRDRINFYVDGVGTRAMTGAADWQTVVLRVEGGQSHKFVWKLIKAKSGAAEDDGAYVRNVEWMADVERLAVGDALGHPEWKWVSDGWRVAQDGDVEGGYYVESVSLGDDSAAVLSTMVVGPAELMFSWKVSSEADYDYLDFFIDGELVAWVDGEQDWDMVSFALTTGVHELKWVYSKDEAVAAGYDRAWIRDVLFKNTTHGTPVEVPYSWLASYPELMTIAKGDYEAAAAMSVVKVSSGGFAAGRIPVWQNYVAGIDPTDSNDVFTATISISGGVPRVSYTPNLGDARKYKIWGKKFLTDKTWREVSSGMEAEYNFFKVTVEMK